MLDPDRWALESHRWSVVVELVLLAAKRPRSGLEGVPALTNGGLVTRPVAGRGSEINGFRMTIVESPKSLAVPFDVLCEHQPLGEQATIFEDLVPEPVVAGEGIFIAEAKGLARAPEVVEGAFGDSIANPGFDQLLEAHLEIVPDFPRARGTADG